jgi:hypothetical protein
MQLVERFREVSLECAQLRFRANFGSQMCESCDGLKSGPGVVATCFQTKRCHYTNVKEGDATPRHLRVIEALMHPKEST